MFGTRVTQIVHPELAPPVGEHGLMVVGPTLLVAQTVGLRQLPLGMHGLNIVHTDDRTQTSVMSVGIAQGGA